MFYLYVIRSEPTGRFCIGQTNDKDSPVSGRILEFYNSDWVREGLKTVPSPDLEDRDHACFVMSD